MSAGSVASIRTNWSFEMRFRIRSSARDETTDALRLSSIEQSISIAIAEAESEKEGLRRRIENARVRASTLLGNETFGCQDREPQKEELLLEAERNLISGEKRIRQLEAHMEHLRKVIDLLKQT
jgi:hypothetical protein